MPTNAINDTGVKYLYDKLHGEIEPIAEAVSDSEVTIEGNPLSFNTLSSQTAKSTILSLEPIQDLHGYDKPWVGGAGKNKLENVGTVPSDTKGLTIVYNSDGSIRIRGQATANVICNIIPSSAIKTPPSTNCILNGCPSGGGTNKYALILYPTLNGVYSGGSKYDNGDGVEVDFTGYDGYYCVFQVWSGQSVDFTVYPMLRLSTETDSTFAPYTNLCPITGRTEIGILGEGENRLNPNTVVAGYLSANGSLVQQSTTNLEYTSNYISLHGATIITPAYNAYTSSEVKWIGIGWYNENDEFMNRQDVQTNFSAITVPTGATKIRVSMRTYGHGVENCFVALVAAAQYSPYTKSNDLTISLGQTVYGGTLDVENGVLVVDMGKKKVSDLSWEDNSTQGKYRYGAFVSDLIPVQIRTLAKLYCDKYETISDGRPFGDTPYYCIYSDEARKIYIHDGRYATVTDFTTNEANTEIVYELATPITINLTPHTINLLKGVNNISTDGDKITLTYRDGKVATLGDLTSAVDELDGKIDESKILTDTVTGDKYILVVTNGVLDIQQISN